MTSRAAKCVITIWLLLVSITLAGEDSAGDRDRSVQHYIDSLFFPAEDAEADEYGLWCHPDSSTVSVDTVGLLKDILIIELTYHCSDTDWCDEGKAILFESGERQFELLYVYTNDCTEVILEPAGIIMVDSAEILFTRSPITGTGGYVEERYWVFSDSAGRPVDLRQSEVTSEALSQVLPQNYHVAWGGFFDIKTLSLECYVRRPGDYNCCPTGGWVALRYEIDGSTLRVVSSAYDPDKIDTGVDQKR